MASTRPAPGSTAVRDNLAYRACSGNDRAGVKNILDGSCDLSISTPITWA
jgi:hypothetical protein